MTERAVGFMPGSGVGIVTACALVLLEIAAEDVVGQLDSQLGAGNGVDGVLEVLAGAGLRTLGSFAVVAEEDAALRVIARGTARVRVYGAGTFVDIDGADLRTWNEQVVGGWEQVLLGLDGQTLDPPSLFELTGHGVVPAGVLVRPNVHVPAVRTEPIVIDGDAVLPTQTSLVTLSQPEPEPPLEPTAPTVLEADPALEADPESEPDPAQTLHPGAFAPPHGGEAAPPEPSASNAYDDMYGHTVQRAVEGAAVRLAEVAPEFDAILGDHDGHTLSLSRLRELQQAESAPGMVGDHDGHTISLAELRASRSGPSAAAPSPSVHHQGGVSVQALVCPSGHPNPTHAVTCTRCTAALTGQPVSIIRPALGNLRLSTGEVVVLDRPVLVGRSPKVEGRQVGELPTLVRLESLSGLSRTHAMFRLEGWQVLVVDMGSANHTTVTLPGRAPRRLHPNEPMLISAGAVVDLGGEVTISYDACI